MIGWKENVGENERKTKCNMNEKGKRTSYLLTYLLTILLFHFFLLV